MYSKAIAYLNSFLNLEQVHRPHERVWNLKRMRRLFEIFGRPEKNIFTVVVGGTKGKGSTSYFLSEILRQAGLKVGFYHSPHLEGPCERICVGGRSISKQAFAKGLFKIKSRLNVIARRRTQGRRSNDNFTYFEILTLLAAVVFQEEKIDVAVYEAGMGGRLDATHVLPAKLIVLTPIHYDHEAFLGNTLSEIAREKAALLVPGRDLVMAPQEPEAKREILKIARARKCPVWPPLYKKEAKVRLLGDFQELNAAVAMRAASLIGKQRGFPIKDKDLLKGVQSHAWPGRMELIKGKPSVLLDGAHNPKSIEALCRNVSRIFPRKRKILVFGTSRDKRFDRMIPFLSKTFEVCILTQSKISRAKDVNLLLSEAKGAFKTLIPVADAREAFTLAKKLAEPNGLIVVTGSFYLVGEIRSRCRSSI